MRILSAPRIRKNLSLLAGKLNPVKPKLTRKQLDINNTFFFTLTGNFWQSFDFTELNIVLASAT